METEPNQLRPIATSNLRDQIEREVRNAILQGTFKPGERLVESVIADQLGVSRPPVREVLSALEREGLVISIPRRGSFVIDFTDKDIDEIYSLRLLVELGALQRAITRFAEQDLAEMQQIVNNLGEAAARQDDPDKIVALDLSFHEHICRVADHSRMYSVWNSMRLQTQLLIGVTSKTHYDHPRQPMELHQAILDAVKAHDLATAESKLTEHITDAQRRAYAALKSVRAADAKSK
jgi:DNA-binding GntR family transcriptional regulator